MTKNLFLLLVIFSKTIFAQINTNKWLYTPSRPSYVDIGKLNVTGNKITVEAVINRTSPYDADTGNNNEEDIVSKHDNPDDANYLLRSNHAAITTTNGYFVTPNIEPIELNKTYHVAVARTQDQIQAYMNSSLPNPTTQPGLLAYHTFDNLLNKQGNASSNGEITGNAVIIQTPFDNLSKLIKKDSIIINEYTPVLNLDFCKNVITVSDASRYNPGDTVLLIQMKGAAIDSSNSPSFGTVTDYANSGNYEFNIIKQKNGNQIVLLNLLKRQYDFAKGRVQLIRVPYFENLNITSTLTCLPWDGNKGGVLVFNVKNSLTMNADIDVSGKGFRHGLPMNSTVVTMNEQQYYYDVSSNKGAEKGESIYAISIEKNYGRGAPANGGGGGNAHNSGGGGGANGGMGGNGGDQWETGKTIAENVGGKGGYALTNNSVLNKLYLGGSGGMGQANDQREYPAGNGGGIVIINAASLSANNFSIKANGNNATEAPNSAECKDGMAGGGAGGTVFLDVNNITDQLSIEAKGGKGADHIATNVLHGPGGGGGGGVVAINQATAPSQYIINLSGGINGVNKYHNNDPYGATPGIDGIVLNNFKAVLDDVPFIQNIDSIRISQFNHDCTVFDFKALAFTKSSPIISWNWDLGDGGTSNSQNVTYDYSFGNYNVKLTGIDANGCKDSFLSPITIKNLNVTKRSDTTLCGSSPVKMFAAGGSTYLWAPANELSDPNIADPVATPLTTTKYFITVSTVNGCSAKDSVNITVNTLPVITKSNDTTICYNSPAQLLANGGSSYSWTPSAKLNDANISNPLASPVSTTTYQVKVTNTEGCSDIASIKVNVKPIPAIIKSNDSTICKSTSVKLFVNGGTSYKWFPSSSLDNSTGSTAIASPSETTLYHIDITDINSCIYHDSIKISVRPSTVFSVSPDNSVCAKQSQQLMASGGDSYTWTPALFLDNPNVSNPVATPDSSITYSVTINENTCHESAILFTRLNVLPSPDVHIIKLNDISCALPSARLTAYGGDAYLWTPASGLSNVTISNPVASPVVSTVYTVTAKGINGCVNSDTVSVKVDLNENRFFGLPNSFTPNGDGLNDCFGVKYWGHVDDLNFSIYNRFGQRVFFTNNAANCWDGTFKGEQQDADVYVFIIKAKTVCGNINKKGTVTLLR